MRVSKTVKDYITREVNKRVKARYADEQAIAEKQDKAIQAFREACMQYAQEAYNAYFDEHFNEIKDFTEDMRKEGHFGVSVYGYPVRMKPETCTTINQLNTKIRAEANEIIDNIIVTLELGGNKSDLEQMLSNI